jgi:hypothetical protein
MGRMKNGCNYVRGNKEGLAEPLTSVIKLWVGLWIEPKTLHGEGWRLSVRAVKAAVCAFIGAKRRSLTGVAGGSGAGFGQDGYSAEPTILVETHGTGVKFLKLQNFTGTNHSAAIAVWKTFILSDLV